MRDIVLTLIIVGSLPYILMRPHIGIFMWSWIGYMNPHRLTWGFAYSLPFAQMVAIATLISVIVAKEKKALPITPISVTLILFIIFISVGTIFAIDQASAINELIRIYKIQLVIFLTMMLITDKEKINQLVWVIAVSIGFFGIKGGIFSVLSGGGFRVWGPPGSFIEGNNELGLALLMTIPLFFYLRETLTKKWHKNLIFIAIALISISVLSTYSRGAFLAFSIMALFLWLKMPNKLPTAMLGIVFIVLLFSFMPEKYFNRINTIQTYEEDGSAMGRINAWTLAVNIAQDRFFAGGLNHWSAETFQKYSPVPEDVHDAHSIYFEVLGEHGFLGLFLFLLLYFLTWRRLSWVIEQTKNLNGLIWCNSLARMVQVSLVGYLTGGAFLGLAYWDMPYHLIALAVVMGQIVENNKGNTFESDTFKDTNMTENKIKQKKWAWEK